MDDRITESVSPLIRADEPWREPATKPARRSRWGAVLWILFALLAAAAIAWVVLRPHATPPVRGGRFSGNGPMPVGTAVAAKGDMPVTLNALGTVTPLAMVTVRTQINGQLVQVAFTEGQTVSKGDFLAQIDPRPYQAVLDQVTGQLMKDQALLSNAETDLARFRKLAAQDSIAKQQVDTQQSLVLQLQGTVRTDQALVDSAKLNLAYCRIVSPVTGRIGLRQVDQGNYVQVSDPNGLATVTQLKPISVIFTVPEDNLPPILQRLHSGAALQVVAFDRTRTQKLATGALTTVDNTIDTSTGTVKLRAQFDNSDEGLFPNQFVNAQLLVDTLHDTVIVPTAAIQRGAPGTFVYVVAADETVTVHKVKLGPADGERIAVVEGLSPGDKVVTDGADKLREGAKVTLPVTNQTGANATGAASPEVTKPGDQAAPQRARGQGGGQRQGNRGQSDGAGAASQTGGNQASGTQGGQEQQRSPQ